MEVSSDSVATPYGGSLLERLPENILINEIFVKLEPETLTSLCSVSCVSQTLHSSVNKALLSISSIDLSAFSLDSEAFDGIAKRFGKVQKIALDCLRLSDSSVGNLLGPHVEELILLKCGSSDFYKLLCTIGETCPNLRMLTVDFNAGNSAVYNFIHHSRLGNCPYLESLIIKFHGKENDLFGLYHSMLLLGILPQSVKALKLEHVSESDTLALLTTLADSNMGVPVVAATFGKSLTQISLVLDIITDILVRTIAGCLPLLTELDLKDQPDYEPAPSNDLSDKGVLLLARGCRNLTSLSLVRSKRYVATTFKRITKLSMMFLLKGCKGLEFVRLGGFSKVSDAGFRLILNSCSNLKKVEIENAFLLTDLSLQDVSKAPGSLVEVKLVSCRSITSKAVRELAACSSLEVLDLRDCRQVTDSCLDNILCLTLLTSLNLENADVTDGGMAILGKGNAPISRLSLRGCKRVTEEGITYLLASEGNINKTLSFLDLGYMRGITDNAITTIADACVGLTELCIRSCFNITDASVKVLALKQSLEGERKLLRMLDLYKCIALSAESFEYLKKPMFRGLQWVGIGETRLYYGEKCVLAELLIENPRVAEIHRERQSLFICIEGCEMGCRDGWSRHFSLGHFSLGLI